MEATPMHARMASDEPEEPRGRTIARGPDATQPLDEKVAVELWRDIRRFVSTVRLIQAPVQFEGQAKASGRERGEEFLRIMIGDTIGSSALKMIQAAATSAGRTLVIESGDVVIY